MAARASIRSRVDLGLAIDRDRLAGQRLEVDAMAHAVERDLGPVVDEALALQPRAGARFVDQRDRALFEHAGADAAEHIVLAISVRG